jgi:hypothetical protein
MESKTWNIHLLMAFPMLENIALEAIGTSAPATLNFIVMYNLSLGPMFIQSFSKNNVLAIMPSTSKFLFSIFYSSRAKKGPQLCVYQKIASPTVPSLLHVPAPPPYNHCGDR